MKTSESKIVSNGNKLVSKNLKKKKASSKWPKKIGEKDKITIIHPKYF